MRNDHLTCARSRNIVKTPSLQDASFNINSSLSSGSIARVHRTGCYLTIAPSDGSITATAPKYSLDRVFYHLTYCFGLCTSHIICIRAITIN
uniref:Uncharacterized protein n=1 Tax=Steinernema glaseri TaxID=37863 RepID=A0A1I7Y752_9BILA